MFGLKLITEFTIPVVQRRTIIAITEIGIINIKITILFSNKESTISRLVPRVMRKRDSNDKIIYFINKNEVQWQYTLGLYQLCRFWKNTSNEVITYGQLDSTLRILEQQKFRGFDEWRNILLVNEYMKALHEDYTKDLAVQIALSQKHNSILERMDLIGKVTTDEGHEAE